MTFFTSLIIKFIKNKMIGYYLPSIHLVGINNIVMVTEADPQICCQWGEKIGSTLMNSSLAQGIKYL